MKILLTVAVATSALALGGCGKNADDQAAANIEAMTENKADALDAQADAAGNDQMHDALEAQADAVKENGEDAADKADDDDDARVEQQVKNTL